MPPSNNLLIRTKWSPPRVSSQALPRERLIAQLEAVDGCRLRLILGPAGSGKTTLAAQWRQQLISAGNDVAWYNVGPDDDALWAAYLVGCLETAGLAVSDEMIGLSQRNDQRSLEVLLPLLVNALHAHAQPLYLFLEDLQFLAVPLALDMIQRLIDLAPDNFHVVICSRQRPPLDLLAMEIKGQLTQISFADLRLTSEEQTRLLTQQGISGLSGTQQRRLYELTDGWVAGLQMSTLSIKHGCDFEHSIRGWCGTSMASDECAIDAFLDDCIERVLSPEQIALMVQISTCRRLNRELCVALSGNPLAGDLLDILIEQSIFLLPIDSDDAVQWYRFHRMFAGYLDRRRSRLPTQEAIRINRAASTWFADQGLHVEAIRHAQYAGDVRLSAELLTRASRELIRGAHFALLLQLVEELPRAAWCGQIELLLAVGWAELYHNRLGEFEHTMREIVAHPAAATPAVDFERRLLRALYCLKRDDTEAALELLEPFIEPCIEPPTDASNFQVLMLYILTGMALFKARRVSRTRDVVHAARRKLAHGHGRVPRPFLDVLSGMSFFMQGDQIQARRELESALGALSHTPWMAEDASCAIKATLALTCYLLGDQQAAEQYVDDCIDVVEVLGTTDSMLYAFIAKGRLQASAGLFSAAHDTLERLGAIAERLDLDRLQAWRYAEQARIACLAGELPLARESVRCLRRVAQPYTDKRDCAWAEIPLALAMGETDLAIAEGDYPRVAALSEQLSQICQSQELGLLATFFRLRGAIALNAPGQAPDAEPALRTTLRCASEYGMLQVFLDEGEAGVRLLESLRGSAGLTAQERDYVQRCLARSQAEPSGAAGPGGPDGQPVPTGAGVTLSARELEIVGLLSRALSNKSIARALNLSPGTVKWHLKNVFAKLEAFSREDAVFKARQRGLVH